MTDLHDMFWLSISLIVVVVAGYLCSKLLGRQKNNLPKKPGPDTI